MLKKILLIVLFLLMSVSVNFSFADDDTWTLIPKANWDVSKIKDEVKKVASKPWEVWKNYDEVSKNIDPGTAFATWIFSWDTIFAFLKHIAKLLSEMWLVIGAGMIIYAGYKYASWVFTWDASKWWKDAIKWAIYGLLIVIFSYAIMRLLLAMFW